MVPCLSLQAIVEAIPVLKKSIKAVLDELAAGANTIKAINNGISLSNEEFDQVWEKSLEWQQARNSREPNNK